MEIAFAVASCLVRAIIFDLDNCLAAADEPGEQLLEPVFAAVRAVNDGALAESELEAAFRDCWVHAFDFVAATHRFTPRMLAAGWEAFRRIEVRAPLRGYGDLTLLPSLGAERFLVTSGFRRLQESKVRALGIETFFDAIVVDAIDEPERRGKERIFLDLMRQFRLDPNDVLIVGDNAESELGAAARLGLRSAQLIRPGVTPAAGVTIHLRDLGELREWLRLTPLP
ncbi:MAG TPA: HAD family hydrolase [Gemmatimonadaceae bacterium]|nr:HAD family hydrolase [Gemmatimonadaceae bacterium]